jgi:tetratricopeptide (TPR) repeat protein
MTWPLASVYCSLMTSADFYCANLSSQAFSLPDTEFGRIAVALGMIVSALFLAQGVPFAAVEEPAPADVAYEELAAGRTEGAIASLEASLRETPGDPALLINLGTAYARAGRLEEARDAFRAAIAAEDRYRVQLADGSWEDSRKIARLALDSLDRTAFAAR